MMFVYEHVTNEHIEIINAKLVSYSNLTSTIVKQIQL